MRLLHTYKLTLQYFNDPNTIPRYAILSHTWEEFGELSLEDMLLDAKKRPRTSGYAKIKGACNIARRHGLKWIWIDTCCIDKSSSTELSEAINSMYRYYKSAKVCYVYLSDLSDRVNIRDRLRKCRWVTRGWTLQELIAPHTVRFYNRKWKYCGSKRKLQDVVAIATGIPAQVLTQDVDLEEFSLAQRMSWAARRRTTRAEDLAYCLLGIFGVNMPLLYGEGNGAFRRLQEEIIKRSTDLSILAHVPKGNRDPGSLMRVLASSPSEFAICGSLCRFVETYDNITVTNNGLVISRMFPLVLVPDEANPDQEKYMLLIGFDGEDPRRKGGIFLRKIGPKLFHREAGTTQSNRLWTEDTTNFPPAHHEELRILIDVDPTITSSLVRDYRQGSIYIPDDEKLSLNDALPDQLWDARDRTFLNQAQTAWGSQYDVILTAVFFVEFRGCETTIYAFFDRRVTPPRVLVFSNEQRPPGMLMALGYRSQFRAVASSWFSVDGQVALLRRDGLGQSVDMRCDGDVFRFSPRLSYGNYHPGISEVPMYKLEWHIKRIGVEKPRGKHPDLEVAS